MDVPGSPAEAIYRSIGVYLGHPWPCTTTSTASGTCCCWVGSCPAGGGDLILDTAKKVLAEEYPEMAGRSAPPSRTRSPAGSASPWPPPSLPELGR